MTKEKDFQNKVENDDLMEDPSKQLNLGGALGTSVMEDYTKRLSLGGALGTSVMEDYTKQLSLDGVLGTSVMKDYTKQLSLGSTLGTSVINLGGALGTSVMKDYTKRLSLGGALGTSVMEDYTKRLSLGGALGTSVMEDYTKQLSLDGVLGTSVMKDYTKQLSLGSALGTSVISLGDALGTSVMKDYTKQLSLGGALGTSVISLGDALGTSVMKDYMRLGYSKNLLEPKVFVYKPVIKELSLNDERDELRYIEDKIPTNKFYVTHAFNSEKDSLEYNLENEDSNEAIPIQELTSTLAITDVFSSLTMNEVVSFYSHLAKLPMLGLHHPVGQRILYEINNVQMAEVKDLHIFRVRNRSQIDRQIPFVDSEMFEAPHGYATQGRFNHQGHGELYVCDNKNVAIKEVISKEKDLRYEIIEWKLEESVKLIDLSHINSPLAKYCSFHKTTPNGQEYLIPNFIAQCAKHQKISGIRYNSVHDNEALNYVFFDFEEKWFKTIHLDVDLELEFLEECIRPKTLA